MTAKQRVLGFPMPRGWQQGPAESSWATCSSPYSHDGCCWWGQAGMGLLFALPLQPGDHTEVDCRGHVVTVLLCELNATWVYSRTSEYSGHSAVRCGLGFANLLMTVRHRLAIEPGRGLGTNTTGWWWLFWRQGHYKVVILLLIFFWVWGTHEACSELHMLKTKNNCIPGNCSLGVSSATLCACVCGQEWTEINQRQLLSARRWVSQSLSQAGYLFLSNQKTSFQQANGSIGVNSSHRDWINWGP